MHLDAPSLALPYVGEFGWEVMHWQSWLRAMARASGRRIAVSARPESHALYEDFCACFHPHQIRATRACFCTSRDPKESAASECESGALRSAYGYADVIRPGDIFKESGQRHEFVPLGGDSPDKSYDVIIHARAHRNQCFKNYRYDSWSKVVSMLRGLRIGVLASGFVYDLSRLGVARIDAASVSASAKALTASRVFVGPDSGALHLAALARTPRVTWLYDIPFPYFGTRSKRIMKMWNPFDVDTRLASTSSYQPEPEAVVRCIEELLKRN